MAQKKGKRPVPLTAAQQRVQIERALQEGRTQQALELSRALHKQEPTPENKELLKKTCLARGRDLLEHGMTRDAHEVLNNALGMDTAPTWQAEVALELIHAGGAARALEIADRLTDPAYKSRILGLVADEAVRRGAMGKHLLPEALRPQHELILKAFEQQTAGQDEQARETLQGIGLTSPFLEWKLLLRGLLAYYASDDVRALENWQRLDPKRWPFRLAAPLRFQIDKQFAGAQTPEAKNILQQQLERLQGAPETARLKKIRVALSAGGSLAQPFREADLLVPELRKSHPHLVPRLAWCFYWAIIARGQPEDMKRYLRVFGPLADDPKLHRLEAMVLEKRGQWQQAQECWNLFEKSIASNPHWPDAVKNRVRALVWYHMGINAEEMGGEEEPEDDFGFFPFGPPPVRLDPPAEKCFQESVKLAPDLLDAHRALFNHFLTRENLKKALKAGQELLRHFPNHVETIEKLGDVYMAEEAYDKALERYQEAARLNPLERRLRVKLSTCQAYRARELAVSGKFDEARKLYASSLALDERGLRYPTLCKWSACEFKAGDKERGEELLRQAYDSSPSRLGVTFCMLIETIRFGLTRLKPRFHEEFNQLLDGEPLGRDAVAVASTSALLQQAGVKYHGQQTHEKKVLKYLEKAREATFTEEELRQVCSALVVLRKPRLEMEYIRAGQRQFPDSPRFLIAEVEHGLRRGRGFYGPWPLQQKLKKARQLAEKLPRGEREEMLEEITQMEQEVQNTFPFAGFLGELGGIFGGPDDDMPDDEDDYDDY